MYPSYSQKRPLKLQMSPSISYLLKDQNEFNAMDVYVQGMGMAIYIFKYMDCWIFRFQSKADRVKLALDGQHDFFLC